MHFQTPYKMEHNGTLSYLLRLSSQAFTHCEMLIELIAKEVSSGM